MPARCARSATTGDKRSTVLPDVPTVSEAGVPGYEATIWLGIMAPKGTPPEIVDRLNAEIAKIIAKPAIREAWAKQGAVPDDHVAGRSSTPSCGATSTSGPR